MEHINSLCVNYSEWKSIMAEKLKTATRFEIHCWPDEEQWYLLALNFGAEKNTTWNGKIVSGSVTPAFCDMLLGLEEPTDKEIG